MSEHVTIMTLKSLLGVSGAKAGTLSFLVGGTAEAFESARPILGLMGQRIIHCGGTGSGLGKNQDSCSHVALTG